MRIFLLFTFFSPVATLLVASADDLKSVQPARATPAQQEFLNGQAALSANKLPEAQACFQRSIQLDPKLLNPVLGLAELEILKNNAAGADQYLLKATAMAPKDANVWTVRGHYLFFRKSYPEAEQAFNKAIALDPKLERPHYELGDLYLLGFHNPQAAITAYQAALAINRDDSRVHYTMANALAEVGRLDEAQAQLVEAARLDPQNLSLQISIGDFNLKRGNLDLAQQAFDKALSINPAFVPARLGQGDVFVARKDLDHALLSYQAALQYAPNSTAAQVKIAVLQELKGQWNEAEQSYRNALKLDPKLLLAANNLAWILNEHQNKSAEALKWATSAASLAPQDFNTQDTLGWVLRSNGNLARALATLKNANSLAPDNPQILYHLGVVYQETKQPQLAVEYLSRALSFGRTFDGAADAKARLVALRNVS